MRFDTRTALVMKKAARGPAAIALRQQRILKATGVNAAAGVIQGGLGGPARMLVSPSHMGARLVGAGVGSASMGAARLVSAGAGGVQGGLTGFGAVDTSAIAQGTASKGAGVAATAGVAHIAALGSAAGPIGLVVGAIVGIAVAELLHKNYINVAQMNQAQDAELAIFNKYLTIQGKVPGRAIGLPTMVAIWKGSEHVGHFPLAAKQKQCFHEGCFKYGGRGDWIDTTISDNASYQFPQTYKRWMQGRQNAAVAVQTNYAPRAVTTIAPTPNQVRQIVALRGLGSLGAVSLKPDAVSFIDDYFIPGAQAGDKLPWEVPTDPIAHQLLYDLADAYLATMPVTTTPFVAVPNAEYGAPPPPVTTPQPMPVVPPASSGPTATTSYPGYTYMYLSDPQGRPLYASNSDSGKVNQYIPLYTPVAGQMVADGQFYNAATVVGNPPVPGTPGNIPVPVPVQPPGNSPVVYQPAPGAPTNAPVAAPAVTGTNWGPLIAIAAGALTLMR
jgi:hypothetical protein